MIGPTNADPRRLRRWIRNNPTRTTTTAASTHDQCHRMPRLTFTADSTKSLGTALSPKQRRADRPQTTNTNVAMPGRCRASVVSAMMPPSPWLSARSTNIMYLIENHPDQRPEDQRQNTQHAVVRHTVAAGKHSLRVYNGLVPMSP